MGLAPLPVDAHLEYVRGALARHRAVVLCASPGAGKTTRVPPALLDAGPVILLQPRRVAARAAARRIASEQDWTIGREIGWQVRFEKRFTRDTRLLVVTEGILTAKLQQDPLLSGFSTVILDEFHERTIHGDLGLALARQAWIARDDLRIVLMSATLDAAPAAAFLGGAPIVTVPGVVHPLTIDYADGESIADAARALAARTSGQILCFLAGVSEIEHAQASLVVAVATGALPRDMEIVRLHGSLDAAAQDEALRPAPHRRIILSTNVAETSLTVPGVSGVIDAGRVKVARYDAEKGIDSLELERVTLDSADQRAGRAARLGPGYVRRLWDRSLRLRPHREPDIARVDLAGPVLDVIAWGADPVSFEWFEPPDLDRMESALAVLRSLDAIDRQRRLTSFGKKLQRIPVHPRIATILLDGRGAAEVAITCAQLSERARGRSGDEAFVRDLAAALRRLAGEALGGDLGTAVTDAELRHALFRGYADRLAKRRPGTIDRFLLASGHGAVLHHTHAASADYIVALDVVASNRNGIRESQIRAFSGVDAEWISPTSTAIEHWFEADSGRVRAARIDRYGVIVLNETPVRVDPVVAAELLADAWAGQEPDDSTTRLFRRLRFAGLDADRTALIRRAACSAQTLRDINAQRVEELLTFEQRRELDALAPASIIVPSGRRIPVEYTDEGTVSAAVKLQELFGLADSPLIGQRHVPLTFHLLAPNGRPVQTTRDLRSFWERTYPEVRRELRGRYPKHPWPEDPWTARATHKTIRKRST